MNAIRSVRKGGTVVLIGNLSPKVEIPLQEVVSREISVLGSCASNGEIPECIDLLARGAVDVDPLISLKASLDDAPGLFERLYGGDKELDESDPSTMKHMTLLSISPAKSPSSPARAAGLDRPSRGRLRAPAPTSPLPAARSIR